MRPTPPRLLPALITPFTSSGELDLNAYQHNLRTLTSRGITGFLVGGSTGEGPYLEPGDRESLVSAARRELGARPFILTGVAAESLRSARAQAEEAAGAGTDAILVMTPTSLVRGNHAAVEGFFEDLADASSVPVYLYSVPAVTGYALPVETAIHLSNHPDIAGMKDSGGDPVAMTRMVEEAAEGFVFMTGSSKAVTLCIAAGAHGAITASSNYVPELVLDVLKSARRSPRSATALQSRLARLSTVVEAYRVPGVKAAAELTGLLPGFPRKPLKRLAARDRKAIEKLLRGEGVI